MNDNENQILAMEMRDVNVSAMRDVSFIVLENVNWSVAVNEFWVVAGPQHSGKTDLLMLAAGLMPPASGSYKLFDRETRFFGEGELPQRLRAGFVFEGGQLFNQLTIAENVALPMRYQKNLSMASAAGEVQLLLELMELTPFADVTPINVAANWRARAALARALIMRPEILLLDNPQAGLQARHLQWWLKFLEQLNRGHEFFGRQPMTIVATADDLRPWQNAQRKFALLRDKKFIPLGSWNEVAAHNDEVVKELLNTRLELTP